MKFLLKSKSQFYRCAQFLLIYTLFVILWGAWVRISHSGDGCGNTWPLCNGAVVPEAVPKKTWVEFSHRLTSGLFGIFVVYMFFAGRKLFGPTEKRIRAALTAALVFMITEALLGAKLVLLGLVAGNDSWFRVFAMSLHQANSLLLSGSVALLVLYSSPVSEKMRAEIPPPKKELSPWRSWGLPVLFILIAVTGAWAALSSTLFPAKSLAEGLVSDFAQNTPNLVRLRISHPILATLIGGSFALYFWLKSQQDSNEWVRRTELQLTGLFAGGVTFGYITLLSLAPVWMKVVHLLLAHLIWITLLRWRGLKRWTA